MGLKFMYIFVWIHLWHENMKHCSINLQSSYLSYVIYRVIYILLSILIYLAGLDCESQSNQCTNAVYLCELYSVLSINCCCHYKYSIRWYKNNKLNFHNSRGRSLNFTRILQNVSGQN